MNIIYPNLKAEMALLNLRNKDIADCIKCSQGTITNKMHA